MISEIYGVSLKRRSPGSKARLCAVFLAGALVVVGAPAQGKAPASGQRKAAAPEVAAPSPQQRKVSFHRPVGLSSRATKYYKAAWGIDKLQVRRTASGNLVRFSYRVTDAERAKTVMDKTATPHLIDPSRGVMLQIPAMENIGQLRQIGPPVIGEEYWMTFSNKGDVVKPGDRVDVLIGAFHADGLPVVE